MKFPSRTKSGDSLPGVSGTARVDRRTRSVVGRVSSGDIAVIDHLDLDRATAEALVDAGVVAVINASASISGRYPTLGPDLLLRAGVVLVDEVGSGIFGLVREGQRVRIQDGCVYAGDRLVLEAHPVTADDIGVRMEQARAGLTTQLESFTHNTTEFLRREQDLLLHGLGAPSVKTRMSGRPAVVVVRGYDYREDLRRLRRYIGEQKPVLIGVDGGADALIAAHHRPDIVVVGEQGLGQSGSGASGRPSAVSDKALRQARDVVLHTDRSGRVVGSDRLERLGVRHRDFAATGTSEDVAMLLADLSGSSLIICVGSHATLDEFLDRHRAGQASTFLTRLRVGPKIVEAKAVPQLYAGRVRTWHLAVVILAALIALLIAVNVTPIGHEWWQDVWSRMPDLLGGSS